MNKPNENEICFHIANRAATHQGRKLYSTTPPALAELIANSYDAYATITHVEMEKGKDMIIVADNGIGLTLEELNKKYALIGKAKVRETAPNGLKMREPMGQKGIGKLASFSLGDQYEVYTKTSENSQWRHFSLNYDDFIKDNERYVVDSKLCELPQFLKSYRSYEHGFITVIQKLRREITASTTKSLIDQLSRRFYIKSELSNFKLYLNDSLIDLSRNSYYGNLDYVTYFGYSKSEIRELLELNQSSIELVNLSLETINPVSIKENLEELLHKKKLKGWIGTVEKPKQLKQHGNNANIIVYINGKIADEDVLKNHGNSMIANQYVVGEIFADYLATDIDDPITSSRQGLDNDDPDVSILIDGIKAIRSNVINSWNDHREGVALKHLPDWVNNNKSYQKWIANLEPSQKRFTIVC